MPLDLDSSAAQSNSEPRMLFFLLCTTSTAQRRCVSKGFTHNGQSIDHRLNQWATVSGTDACVCEKTILGLIIDGFLIELACGLYGSIQAMICVFSQSKGEGGEEG